MRVLLLESDRRAADNAAADLEAAGHQVARCHEQHVDAFPCRALRDTGSCPLEAGSPVDVAVSYRAHPYPKPTALEDGVSCALRHHVPLVVAGKTALNPFDRWTAVIAAEGDDIAAACERAVAQPDPFLSERATVVVRDALIRHGHDAGEASVTVTRRSGRLAATMHIPLDVDRHELGVAVAGALRQAAPHVLGIDVSSPGQVMLKPPSMVSVEPVM